MAGESGIWVRSPRLFSLAVYLTLILLAGIALDIWSDWPTRGLALAATAAFGLLYWRVARAPQPLRRLHLYFAAQAALAFGLLALAFPRDPHYILLIILGIHAMVVLPVRHALVWVALFWAGSSVAEFLRGSSSPVVESIYNITAFALTGAFGYAIRQAELARHRNEELVMELRAAQRQLQDLAIVEERNRLARDLHDSVKQQVFAIGMQLGAARSALPEQAEAYPHVVEAERLARQAGQELTGLIRQLRPAALERSTLAGTLQALVADWARQTQVTATAEVSAEAALSPAAEEALLRVAQEALANVARHSRATSVAVSLNAAGPLDGQPGSVMLSIADNGQGFRPATAARGVGLDSMRERVEALGGRLSIESEPGAGTRVTARLEADHE